MYGLLHNNQSGEDGNVILELCLIFPANFPSHVFLRAKAYCQCTLLPSESLQGVVGVGEG
jgi:hypothetical protein